MAKSKFNLDLNEQFPHLPRAPIVEAVIHWRARAGLALDAESLKETLRNRLARYPKLDTQHELRLHFEVDGRGTTEQSRLDTWRGLRLVSDDGLHVVQFRHDGLVFSRLAPYPTWQEFSTEALMLWRLYRELADPPEVQRLGVRFINRIPIKSLDDAKRYLTQPPKCLEGMGLPVDHFFYQSDHLVPDSPYRIKVVRTIKRSGNASNGPLALIVDIDTSVQNAYSTIDDDSDVHLPKLRWLKDKVFFSLMKPRILREFGKGD